MRIIDPRYDTLGTDGTYTEFPVDLVTDIHWKSPTPTPTPPFPGTPVWVTDTSTGSFAYTLGSAEDGGDIIDIGPFVNDGRIGSVSEFALNVEGTVSCVFPPFYMGYYPSLRHPVFGVTGEVTISDETGLLLDSQGYDVNEGEPDETVTVRCAGTVPPSSSGPGVVPVTIGPFHCGFQGSGTFCYSLWWMIAACEGSFIGTASVTVTYLDHYDP